MIAEGTFRFPTGHPFFSARPLGREKYQGCDGIIALPRKEKSRIFMSRVANLLAALGGCLFPSFHFDEIFRGTGLSESSKHAHKA